MSVVVHAHPHSTGLDRCLASLERQDTTEAFEIVVVDDGSDPPIPAPIADGPRKTSFVRQIRLGQAAARNRGVATSTPGADVLFLDADCEADPGLLRELARTMDAHPDCAVFQVQLTSGDAHLVERIEGIRLAGMLRRAREAEDRVRYVSEVGFAARRTFLAREDLRFDPGALRGDSRLFSAEVLRRGVVPVFCDRAVLRHRPHSSLSRYAVERVVDGYRRREAVDAYRRSTAAVRPPSSPSRSLLGAVFDSAKDASCGSGVLLSAIACVGLERVGGATSSAIGMRHERHRVLSVWVDPIHEEELVARILDAAEQRHPIRVTYLTAWTLVQAHHDRALARMLTASDIVYADGMGVVGTALITGLNRCRKVTAADFFPVLCREAARRELRVALIGTRPSTIADAVSAIRAEVPRLQIVYHHHGFIEESDREGVLEELVSADPDLVVLGMGQPLQERWMDHVQGRLDAPVHCVGGLFDTVSGHAPSPPLWVRRIGFEWLHRLITRPRQFWRRYLIGIPQLAFIVVADRLALIRPEARFRARRSSTTRRRAASTVRRPSPPAAAPGWEPRTA